MRSSKSRDKNSTKKPRFWPPSKAQKQTDPLDPESRPPRGLEWFYERLEDLFAPELSRNGAPDRGRGRIVGTDLLKDLENEGVSRREVLETVGLYLARSFHDSKARQSLKKDSAAEILNADYPMLRQRLKNAPAVLEQAAEILLALQWVKEMGALDFDLEIKWNGKSATGHDYALADLGALLYVVAGRLEQQKPSPRVAGSLAARLADLFDRSSFSGDSERRNEYIVQILDRLPMAWRGRPRGKSARVTAAQKRNTIECNNCDYASTKEFKVCPLCGRKQRNDSTDPDREAAATDSVRKILQRHRRRRWIT